MNRSTPAAIRLSILVTAAALTLTGCATGGGTGTPAQTPGQPAQTPAETPAQTAETPAGQAVAVSDAWVRAAESGMTAAFGELENTGNEDVTVVSAATEASNMVELHETVQGEAGEMVMREVQGGFVIPAGGTRTLEPGGDHIMLMDLTDPLQAGEEITITLTFADQSTYDFTAPARDFAGANENYEDGESDMGMDMGGE